MLRRSKNNRMMVSDISPKGIHHTVSYAVSYNDTWNHIRTEIRKMAYRHQLN
ncbi:MAG: hypothetical protein ACLFUB_09700 [Cyclobacteriaceae bacterium]